MIPENVIVIVKAPNQQIDDQNIECQSSWTVRQLKGHLSEVYPSKPRTDEQKIIYSGQLLDDNTVLKDVLRTYESQLGHTMHLVCAPSKTMTNPPDVESKDGLRQRNVNTSESTEPAATRSETAARPEMRQNDQNHTVEMQNYLTSFVNNYGRVPPYPNYNMGEGYLPVPNDQASLANHMIMMQQAYMRYMQQYANMWQATAANPAPAPPATDAPPAPPAQEAPANVDDEDHHHDWLDHIYSASRIGILVSLIYLYGSPARLLLVIIITGVAYLHHIGFFRELFLNDENPNPNPNRAAQQQPPQQQQQHPPQQEPPQQQPQPPTPNRPEPRNNQTEENRSPSFLAVTWMVFTTFFASLIPDTNQ